MTRDFSDLEGRVNNAKEVYRSGAAWPKRNFARRFRFVYDKRTRVGVRVPTSSKTATSGGPESRQGFKMKKRVGPAAASPALFTSGPRHFPSMRHVLKPGFPLKLPR